MEYENMTGAEFASLLKGKLRTGMKLNGLGGLDDPSLRLSDSQTAWWRGAKLGFMAHFGVYSEIGRGEWSYFNDKFTESDYRKIAAEKFRPKASAEEIMSEWSRAASDAGMKYSVMTTRHHDGFAMWDSDSSYEGFTSARLGPKTDYVRAYTDAFRAADLRVGLYYSPMDWRFPGYFDPVGCPESAELMKRQAYGQLKELTTRYGKLDILWYDGGWLAHKGTDYDSAWLWEPLKLNKMVRKNNPDMLLSPRSGYRGDFEIDEGSAPVVGDIVPIPWEKAMSLSPSWGFRPNDSVFDAAFVIRMLSDAVCRGGNLLLNVCPDGNGMLPPEQLRTLRGLGEWLRANGEAVYDTVPGPWQPVDGVYGSVTKGDAVYLHVTDRDKFSESLIARCGFVPASARLSDGTPVAIETRDSGFRIRLPEVPSEPVTVVELRA